MPTQVTLTLIDERGAARHTNVNTRRFSIGRDPANDLAVDDTNLSRRHALIEIFDDGAQLTDCNSSNGTLVNNAPLNGTTTLRDGDRLTLGGTCDITVTIHTPRAATRAPASANTPPARNTTPRALVPAASSSVNTPTIAAVVAIFIILAAGIIFLIAQRANTNSPRATLPPDATLPEAAVSDANDAEPEASVELATGSTETSTGEPKTDTVDASDEQIERHAMSVMRRITSDDKSYSFSEKAIADIRRKTESYRGDVGLRNALIALRRNGANISALARTQNIEPELAIYAALAATDGGRAGRDASATARLMMNDLSELRATFGSNDADSGLLVIAAYTDGTGTKKSHPLLATIRRLVNNPLTERNVWFLNERGGLSAGAYDFVLRFIALGIIAQHPQDYGVEAEPLMF